MRIALLSGCVAAALITGIPAANAQGTNLAGAAGGAGANGADTTCSAFMAMDESAQADLIAQVSGAGGSNMTTTGNTANGGNAAGGAMAPGGGTPTAGANAMSTDNAGANGNTPAGDISNGTAQAVMAACKQDDKLTVGQALEQPQTDSATPTAQ